MTLAASLVASFTHSQLTSFFRLEMLAAGEAAASATATDDYSTSTNNTTSQPVSATSKGGECTGRSTGTA